MMEHIVLSLDEDDGLDQIYTFRLVYIYDPFIRLRSIFLMYYIYVLCKF